jgi:hypothetical protein
LAAPRSPHPKLGWAGSNWRPATLTFVDTTTLGIAGIVGTLVAGLGGVWLQVRHARRERLTAARAEAYSTYLAVLERQQLRARLHALRPRPRLDDDSLSTAEVLTARARVQLLGSPAVRGAVEALHVAQTEAAMRQVGLAPTRQPEGDEQGDDLDVLEAALRRIEQVMRNELQG